MHVILCTHGTIHVLSKFAFQQTSKLTNVLPGVICVKVHSGVICVKVHPGVI